jgi:hypothetical protein
MSRGQDSNGLSRFKQREGLGHQRIESFLFRGNEYFRKILSKASRPIFLAKILRDGSMALVSFLKSH